MRISLGSHRLITLDDDDSSEIDDDDTTPTDDDDSGEVDPPEACQRGCGYSYEVALLPLGMLLPFGFVRRRRAAAP